MTQQQTVSWLKSHATTLLLAGICTYLGARLIGYAFYYLDGTQAKDVPITILYLLSGGIVLLILPFFRKVKVGDMLELERDIEQTKKELSEFKTEIRSSISVLSTNVNTLGNISNSVTFNLPGVSDLVDAKRQLKLNDTQPSPDQEVKEIRDELDLEDEDTIMALAKTRIKLEYVLRELVGKKFTSIESERKSIRYASLRSLFRQFQELYPGYAFLEQPFQYVSQLANAAVHAQRVSPEQASQAIDLGAELIAMLSRINRGFWKQVPQ